MASKLPHRIEFLLPPGPIVQTTWGFIKDGTTESSQAPPLFLDAIRVRKTVFIEEQKCGGEGELDGEDERSWHWVIFAKEYEGGKEVPAATIRFIPPSPVDSPAGQQHQANGASGKEDNTQPAEQAKPLEPNIAGSLLWDQKEPYATIGRLATVKQFRGRGFASLLMKEAMKWGKEHAREMDVGWKGLINLHGQLYLEKWYQSFGFEVDEGLGHWYEEGIEHSGLWKRLDLTP